MWSRSDWVVKWTVLQHFRLWVRAPAQAMGSSLSSDHGSTNACGYIWWLQVCGSKRLCCHVIFILIQCTPLLVEKAGVTLGSPYASKKECRWEIYSGYEAHEEGHTKYKTGAISGFTKWALVQQIFKKKKELTNSTDHTHKLPILWNCFRAWWTNATLTISYLEYFTIFDNIKNLLTGILEYDVSHTISLGSTVLSL